MNGTWLLKSENNRGMQLYEHSVYLLCLDAEGVRMTGRGIAVLSEGNDGVTTAVLSGSVQPSPNWYPEKQFQPRSEQQNWLACSMCFFLLTPVTLMCTIIPNCCKRPPSKQLALMFSTGSHDSCTLKILTQRSFSIMTFSSANKDLMNYGFNRSTARAALQLIKKYCCHDGKHRGQWHSI